MTTSQQSFRTHFENANIGDIVTIPLSLLTSEGSDSIRVQHSDQMISAYISDGKIIISEGHVHFKELWRTFGRTGSLGLESCMVPVKKVSEAANRRLAA